VPRPDGEIVLGATEEEGSYDARPTLAGLHALTEAALEIVPASGRFVVEGAWAGLRPAAPDRRPIIGWAPEVERLMLMTAHYRNGVLLGPLTARLVAEQILGGSTQDADALAAFTPGRFVRPASAASA
jgi:glycine oxidase